MELSQPIQESLKASILCWLATVSKKGIPNVSPKEIVTTYHSKILIANIASPQSVKNIKDNPEVCLSFIEVLKQKGYQLKGTAKIITNKHSDFESLQAPLLQLTEGKFPFSSITLITVSSGKPIVAPSYIFHPETKETEMIAKAKKVYGV